MRRLVLVLSLLAALAVVPAASAIVVQVSITSPANGAHSLSGVVPVTINASSDVGIYSVQLQVDGTYYGVPVTTQVSPYTYVINLDTSKLTQGTHTLTAIAVDWSQIGGGQRWASAPITVDVGPAYPTIAITSPQQGTYVRGTVSIQTTSTSAIGPATTAMTLDGAPFASSTLNTTSLSDGNHTIAATITDGRGKQASASSSFTVDNTAPTTSLTSPTSGSYAQGTLPARASAIDVYGIQQVQFLVDGSPVGAALTAPDGGSGTAYSQSLSLTGLANGPHTVSDVATDRAGNTTTSAPVAFVIGDLSPSVSLTLPPDRSFAHGSVAVTANVSGGTAPDSVRLLVDGTPTGAAVSTAPYAFTWDTTALPDGPHTLQATVTDAIGRTATSAIVNQTVDNTPPLTYVSAPAPNGFFQTTMSVQAHASDAYGVKSVQFAVDGTPIGPLISSPDTPGGFLYSATLDISGLAAGVHSLTEVATDNAGLQTTSSPVAFTRGTGPGAVTITSPAAFTFARGVQPVAAAITGGTAPFTAKLIVDGVSSSAPAVVTGSTFSFQWNTVGLIDGSHSLAVAVTGADGVTISSATTTVTVDNLPPSATMYLPAPTPGYTYTRSNGPTTLQVHASDAFGVKSVQFTVDGSPTGPLLTAPDSGQLYLYSMTLDTSTLSAGLHSVTAIVTDNAGNTTTAPPLSIKSGPLAYFPVLNYHGITGPLDTNPDIYDQTPAEADAQLAYLQTHGYQATTVEQYQAWLATGVLPAGVTKPVLITVDDGLTDQLAWDPLLQKYGMKAVLYAVTGYADNTTPGANDPTGNMSWAQIQSLAANGRWQIAFHAGTYGHADFSDSTNRINLGGGKVQSYSSTCFAYYNCLGKITTTTIVGGKRRTTTTAETPAQFESQIAAEITAGMTELTAKVPSASTISWACPWNACGQWTNFYNDPSGTLQSWLPGYLASRFPIVFTQTNPVTYGLASGTVGALNGFNRHYRFEVHTDTTIAGFATALTDPAFANN